MDIRFFDRDLRLIRVIDEYVACIFHQKWTDYGSFEIHMDRMDQKLLRAGNYVLIGGDGKKSGRIEYVSASDEDDGKAVAKGHTLLFLLTQRITVPPAGHAYHTFRAPAGDIIRALVRANAVDAADPARNFPLLAIGESLGRGQVLYYQSRYAGLLDAVRELAEASGLGIGIRIDQKARRLVFEVYEGRDLSGRQEGVSPVVFDKELENVYGREYTDDMTRYKNCAYTGGQGDGAERTIYIAGDGNKGEDRYEIFVDARDLADAENLPDRAAVKLADYGRSLSCRSEVDTAGYGVKWGLGDIVMIRDREYGLELAERVTEVEETWDADGKSVLPTLGSAERSLLQLMQEEKGGPLIEGIRGGTGPAGSTGEQGEPGYSIQYCWDGTKLGVKREDETSYQYQDLQGPQGEPGSATVPGDISDMITEMNDKISTEDISGMHLLSTGVTDLDNPPRSFILQSATNPAGLPGDLGGNACTVLQQYPGNALYSGQMAFSFAGNRIALRGRAGSENWSDWRYISPTTTYLTGADLDTVNQPGMYFVQHAYHSPWGDGLSYAVFTMSVISIDDGRLTQQIMDLDGTTYVRGYHDGAFSAWRQLNASFVYTAHGASPLKITTTFRYLRTWCANGALCLYDARCSNGDYLIGVDFMVYVAQSYIPAWIPRNMIKETNGGVSISYDLEPGSNKLRVTFTNSNGSNFTNADVTLMPFGPIGH